MPFTTYENESFTLKSARMRSSKGESYWGYFASRFAIEWETFSFKPLFIMIFLSDWMSLTAGGATATAYFPLNSGSTDSLYFFLEAIIFKF